MLDLEKLVARFNAQSAALADIFDKLAKTERTGKVVRFSNGNELLSNTGPNAIAEIRRQVCPRAEIVRHIDWISE